jgi:hypothetical protein
VQHHPGDEPLPHRVAQPTQVPARVRPGRRVGLDLERDHPPVGEFDDDVHLVPAVAVPGVEQPGGRQRAHRAVGPQLRRHEAVEQPAEQVAVAQHGPLIDAEQRPEQGRVDQVPLGQAHQAVQPVRRPGRQLLGDEQVLQQVVVGARGRVVDPGRIRERLERGHPTGTCGDRLQVPAKPDRIADRAGEPDVPGDDLIEIARQPPRVGPLGAGEGGLREAATQPPGHILPDVRRLGRQRQLAVTGDQPVQQGRAAGPTLELPLDQAVHGHPDDAAGGRPAGRGQIGLGRPGEHEPARHRVIVHGPLDRAEHLGHDLPLVDEQRKRPDGQRRVRIGPGGGGLSRPIQPQAADGVPACGCRLAAGARPDDEDGRMVGDQFVQERVDRSGQVGRTRDGRRLALYQRIRTLARGGVEV